MAQGRAWKHVTNSDRTSRFSRAVLAGGRAGNRSVAESHAADFGASLPHLQRTSRQSVRFAASVLRTGADPARRHAALFAGATGAVAAERFVLGRAGRAAFFHPAHLSDGMDHGLLSSELAHGSGAGFRGAATLAARRGRLFQRTLHSSPARNELAVAPIVRRNGSRKQPKSFWQRNSPAGFARRSPRGNYSR